MGYKSTRVLPVTSSCIHRFWLQSLAVLQASLQKLGCDLIYRQGPLAAATKDIFQAVAGTCDSMSLSYNIDYGCGAEEEAHKVESELAKAAQAAGSVMARRQSG